MGKTIQIGHEEIKPGTRKTVLLPMPELYDSSPLHMPVHVINGQEPGPILCVTAAIHGDELNGVEIIRRLLKKRQLRKISGTLIAVPIVNIYGFFYQDRYLMDRRDLNRSFPGSQKGSLASRLAYLITDKIIAKATHCIDLHSGSLHRTNLPQIRADLDMPGIKSLAKAFNVPVVLHATMRDGSLREHADKQGIPLLLYEAGESLRFDEISIRTGVNGILSVMKKIGLLKKQRANHKRITTAFARTSYWIRAPRSGILCPRKKLGTTVKENEVLAIIANPTGSDEFKLTSPVSGIIIGKSNIPLVHEGAALYHIACVHKPSDVLEQVENLQEFYSEDIDLF